MLNATLFGQMITFAIFAWVTMKFILPQVNAALEARENEIANGLRAAEEGKIMLVKAGSEVDKLVFDTKVKIHIDAPFNNIPLNALNELCIHPTLLLSQICVFHLLSTIPYTSLPLPPLSS